jgi:hypothetical protein
LRHFIGAMRAARLRWRADIGGQRKAFDEAAAECQLSTARAPEKSEYDTSCIQWETS